MEKNGDVIQLSLAGPRGGALVLITDYSNKTVSLIEILPKESAERRVVVWEVQTYTKVGN